MTDDSVDFRVDGVVPNRRKHCSSLSACIRVSVTCCSMRAAASGIALLASLA
jgi:hypothetical protein